MRLRRMPRTLLLGIIIFVGALFVVLAPRPVAAEAGPGGGGGSTGCGGGNFSTCVGAVWRYYKTNSNSYAIKNVGAGYTYATGCASSGGFFAYVLVHKRYPNDPNQVRSWKIGPVNSSGDRSIFFGGWTQYRIYSTPGAAAPTNPTNGDYTWYQAKAAFLQTKAQGQNSGFEWDGSSRLGWFCYSGYSFNLTPTISADTPRSEGATTVTISPVMNNAGPTTSSSAAWRVVQFRVDPGGTVPSGASNTKTPEVQFGAGTLDLKVLKSGNTAFAKGTPSPTAVPMSAAEKKISLGDYKVGTKICFALSVTPYSHSVSSGNWRHSTPYCIVIAKFPKVQILGNDLFVGKGQASTIVTSTSTKTVGGKDKIFGSWGEYGVIASKGIIGMASAAGFNNGATNATLCNLLTFTNEGAPNCGADGTKTGNYSNASTLPSITSRFIVNKPSLGKNPPAFNLEDKAKGVYTATGNVVLSGKATIPAKKWIILNMEDADVRIRDNIEYTDGTLHSPSDIPQVVIIANSIKIDASVTRLDAWLIATGSDGTIDTCYEVGSWSDLNSDKCDKRLTVNGPVVAKHLILQRTAGSEQGNDSGDPAEKFNFRPDAYLWATAWISDSGRLQTTFSKELPPRF